jgi:hypothetical protein
MDARLKNIHESMIKMVDNPVLELILYKLKNNILVVKNNQTNKQIFLSMQGILFRLNYHLIQDFLH